jgi:large conductance mechanosensitive channel
MGLVQEFKDFAMRGNVVDLAVGVIIGGAFGTIVTSMVNDILMPPIGMLMGKVDFKDLKIVMADAVMEGDKVITPAVAINYGSFINTIINFLIVAFCIFMVIKGMNAMKKKKEAAPAPPAAPPAPSREEQLLTEIRDALVKRG